MIRLPLSGQSTGLADPPLAVVLALQAVGGPGNVKLSLDKGPGKVEQGIWTSDGFKFC